MQYASFWRRFAAALIDSLVVKAGAFVLGSVVGAACFSAGMTEEGASAAAFVLGILFSLAYSVLFTGLVGQTPGKMAVGIKVVLADGRVPGTGRAFLREVVGKFLSALVLCIGYFWMLWDSERQCWHDKLVGTRVVRVVRAAQANPAVKVY
ncbi:MAG: RDD family protein [Bacillota bacterium]